MISLNVNDESSALEAVILGLPDDFGGTPHEEDAYDPKSRYHIRQGTFPTEADIRLEMEAFRAVLEKHGVTVYRPENIPGLNQVFSRDIGMTIGDRFVVPKILENREREVSGIEHVVSEMDGSRVLRATGDARLEGGDIMPYKAKIFAGYSRKPDFDKYVVSRTNEAGIDFLCENFSDWEVIPIELNKSDEDPYANALHLDCCFQPVGKDQAILFPGGFKNAADIDLIMNVFGHDNVIEITREEMYQMCSNVFSISTEIVVSERGFTRLNKVLRDRGFTVEEIPYAEIAKMEGLLRCSTLPLRRKDV